MNQMYNIVIKESDDIEIQEVTCRKPFKCECAAYVYTNDVCGYDRYMVQQKLIDHYLKRARAISEMNNEQFMRCYGFYFDEDN